MEKFVHKMWAKLLDNGVCWGRVTTFPIEQSVRFDDVTGIPSRNFSVSTEHMRVFLTGVFSRDDAEMHMREIMTGDRVPIDLRADPGMIERINRTLIERSGFPASFTSESKSGGGRNG